MKSNVTAAFVRVLRAGVFSGIVAGLSGCAHQVYNVKVDAIQNPEVAAGFSYRLVDREAARATIDPHHAAAMDVVRVALSMRGMYEAPDPAQAEVEVVVDYGVGPQRLKVQDYDLGWEPSVERAPLALVPLRKPDGSIGYAAIPAERLDFDGTYRGIPVLRGVYVFEKFLSITACETAVAAGPKRRPVEAWQVHARLEDPGDSLDGYLPILAGAAADYLGTQSDGQQALRLRGDSPLVAEIAASR